MTMHIVEPDPAHSLDGKVLRLNGVKVRSWAVLAYLESGRLSVTPNEENAVPIRPHDGQLMGRSIQIGTSAPDSADGHIVLIDS